VGYGQEWTSSTKCEDQAVSVYILTNVLQLFHAVQIGSSTGQEHIYAVTSDRRKGHVSPAHEFRAQEPNGSSSPKEQGHGIRIKKAG
jgi:hypothetical protein